MRTREQHVAAFLQRALRQRKLLEGEVRGQAAELQALRHCLRDAQLDSEEPATTMTASAVALANRQRYRALAQARTVRLAAEVGEAEQSLGERRAALGQAAQQAQVWEKLAARLEQKRTEHDQRLQQESIDQVQQARRPRG